MIKKKSYWILMLTAICILAVTGCKKEGKTADFHIYYTDSEGVSLVEKGIKQKAKHRKNRLMKSWIRYRRIRMTLITAVLL